MGNHLRKTISCLAILLLLADAGRSMTPPTMAVQVIPGSPLRGLGSATGEGAGFYLTTRQSTRDTLRHGTHDLPNPLQEKSETWQTALLLDHRLTRDWSAVLSIPYLYSKASVGDFSQTTRGLGDVGLFGRYSFWKERLVNPRREWLGILGLELPTGSTSEKDSRGEKLSATQQPGSGTTDLVAGTALVWGLSRLSLYGDASYKINGHRAYTFGDALTVNAGLNLPLPGDDFSVIGEINGEFLARDKSDFVGAPGRDPDGSVANTGGETVYFSPALQWRPGGWALTAGAQWPIYQNFRGVQLKADVNYTLGLSTRFGQAQEANP